MLVEMSSAGWFATAPNICRTEAQAGRLLLHRRVCNVESRVSPSTCFFYRYTYSKYVIRNVTGFTVSIHPTPRNRFTAENKKSLTQTSLTFYSDINYPSPFKSLMTSLNMMASNPSDRIIDYTNTNKIRNSSDNVPDLYSRCYNESLQMLSFINWNKFGYH